MEKFSVLKGQAAPLIGDNIDTDVIIPMDRYILANREDIHEFAFEPLRFHSDGSKNLNFILNQESFVNSKILIVGHNFGCGSSRESAVWAILGLGIKCIIGRSVGTIFFNNCFQNGVLPIIFEEHIMKDLTTVAFSCSLGELFSVDLLKMEITSPRNKVWSFEVEDYRRMQLLDGVDDINLTLQKSKEIEEFRIRDRMKRPWVYL